MSFVVPTAEVAQYQIRLDDRVAIHIPPDQRVPVIIGGFAFENDETATPFGGQGRIQLSGTGPLPVA